MNYGNKDFLYITESEKDRILNLHKSFTSNQLFDTVAISMQQINEKDFKNETDKFNEFIYESFLNVFNSLVEQKSEYGFDRTYGNANNAEKALAEKRKLLNQAINHIKVNGVESVFEGLRNALLSGVGTAVQIALSFTGVGSIAVEIAWGLMTLYDGYQYFFNKKTGSLANLIIDLICLLTAGALGKVLSKFVGIAETSIKGVLGKFINGGLGNELKPIISSISSMSGKVSTWLSEASKFLNERMGIAWASKSMNSVTEILKSIGKDLSELLGKNVTKVVSKLGNRYITLGINLANKFELPVIKKMASLTPNQTTQYIGKQISSGILKGVERYVEKNLKEKPTVDALEVLDNQFGTDIADLYVAVLTGKKLMGYRGKIQNMGNIIQTVTSDAVQGTNTLEKGENLSKKMSKSLAGI
jgi:hypothetical protein